MINYGSYLIMAMLLIITPGADYVLITKNTLRHGVNKGYFTLLGTCGALLCHTFFAMLGLSALLVKSAYLFSIIKFLGAFYLVFIGLQSLGELRKKAPAKLQKEVSLSNVSSLTFLKQGLLTNILNPKVALFFLTFLPQFVNTQDNSHPLGAFFILGITYVGLSFLWYGLYILVLNKVRFIMEKEWTQKIISAISGLVLILFGVKLAFEK